MKTEFNIEEYKTRLKQAQVYARQAQNYARLQRQQAVTHYPLLGWILDALWTTPAKVVYILIVAGAITMYIEHRREIERDRLLHTDVDRVSNLQQLSIYIVDYYRSYHSLPNTLKDLEAGSNPNFIRDEYLYDPETFQLYTYKLTSRFDYQLCATFHYSTADLYKSLLYTTSASATWDHHPGENCFDLAVTPNEKPLWMQQ